MASGTRQDNTMSEGLRKLLGDISEMKLAPDADLPFLIQLETQVLGKLKGGVDQALDPNSGGGPAGLMGSPAGTPGLMQGPGPMNPDELRRMLGASRMGHLANNAGTIGMPT